MSKLFILNRKSEDVQSFKNSEKEKVNELLENVREAIGINV